MTTIRSINSNQRPAVVASVLVSLVLAGCSVTNDSLWPAITPENASQAAGAGRRATPEPQAGLASSLRPVNVWDVAGGVALLIGCGGAMAMLWRLPVMNRRFDKLRRNYATLANRRDKGAKDLVELSLKVSALNQQLQSLQGEIARRPMPEVAGPAPPEVSPGTADRDGGQGGPPAVVPSAQPRVVMAPRAATPPSDAAVPALPVPVLPDPVLPVPVLPDPAEPATPAAASAAAPSLPPAANGRLPPGDGAIVAGEVGPAPSSPTSSGSAAAPGRSPQPEGYRPPPAATPLPPLPPPVPLTSGGPAATVAAQARDVTLMDLVDAINGEGRRPVQGISFVELDFADPPDQALLRPGQPPPTRLRRVTQAGPFLLVMLDGDDWLFPSLVTLQVADRELSKKGIFEFINANVDRPRLKLPAQMREVGGLWEVTEAGRILLPG